MFKQFFTIAILAASSLGLIAAKPNIVLVMADDQGWGQTGFRNHPALKTPHLDAMAANGLRFERFYAGGPVCSPTRATVLTGRTHDRTGVFDHGYALRQQEKTLGQATIVALRGMGHTVKVTDSLGAAQALGLSQEGKPFSGAADPRGRGVFSVTP